MQEAPSGDGARSIFDHLPRTKLWPSEEKEMVLFSKVRVSLSPSVVTVRSLPFSSQEKFAS